MRMALSHGVPFRQPDLVAAAPVFCCGLETLPCMGKNVSPVRGTLPAPSTASSAAARLFLPGLRLPPAAEDRPSVSHHQRDAFQQSPKNGSGTDPTLLHRQVRNGAPRNDGGGDCGLNITARA